MLFKESRYLVIENVLPREVIDFCYEYILLKKKVYATFVEKKFISPYDQSFGTYEKPADQVPSSFCHYGDVAMEILLQKVKPIMEKETNLKLLETYSYVRVYKKGDMLPRHKDRPSCEISTTLNLGGDPYPIYLSPNENVGEPDGKNITVFSKAKGIKLNLKPGDMLIYKGQELEHWREPFEGNQCVQVFLHYNDAAVHGEKNKFDKRLHLGLPLVDDFLC